MKHILQKGRFSSKTGFLAAIAIIVILTVAGFAWGVRSMSKDKKNPSIASARRTDTQQVSRQARGPVQTVRFTLYDVGIYPRRAKARAGLVAITFDDLSGGTSGLVVTKLDMEETVRVGVVECLTRHWRGRAEMALEAGRYEIFDSSRPGNRAALLIEP